MQRHHTLICMTKTKPKETNRKCHLRIMNLQKGERRLRQIKLNQLA